MKIPNIYKGFFKYNIRNSENYIIDDNIPLRDLAKDISDFLIQLNGDKVQAAILSGERDMKELLSILADWGTYMSQENRIMSFVGLRITTFCNLIGKDKCIYCDQRFIPENVVLDDYKLFLDSMYKRISYGNFYLSISGGEPLLWGEKLYGENGLIRYIRDKGTYINMNSDLHLLNTDNTMKIILSGLQSLRVSFDISDEYLFDEITTEGAFQRTLFSVFLLIRYKEIYKINKPKLYFNVVATKVNLNYYGELIDFLIEFIIDNMDKGNLEEIKSLMNIHLIPLGGEQNRHLMPEKEDWERYINVTLPKCKEKWKDFIESNELGLFEFDSFANPLNIDMYNRDVEDIIKDFIDGEFNRHAKRLKCYCAPTQMYILPNGDVYPCGNHAESSDTFILGNIKQDDYETIFKRNIEYLNNLPNDKCSKCPISTIKMNVRIEEKLTGYIESSIANLNQDCRLA